MLKPDKRQPPPEPTKPVPVLPLTPDIARQLRRYEQRQRDIDESLRYLESLREVLLRIGKDGDG